MSNEERGVQIRKRLTELGISDREFPGASERVVGYVAAGRDTLSKAIRGVPTVQPQTYDRIEYALDRLWEEHHMDGPDAAPLDSGSGGMIEFDVSGNFGVHVVVKGPVSNAAELEQAAMRFARSLREQPDDDAGDAPNQP